MREPAKPKTPLKKEELEAIAKELKKKLSRASVAAKSHSPTLRKLPLKQQAAAAVRKQAAALPTLLPLYSPHKLPTKKKPLLMLAVYLLLLPLKTPLKTAGHDLPTKRMVLEPALAPLPVRRLKPLLEARPAPAAPPPSAPLAPALALAPRPVTTPKQQRRDLVSTPNRSHYDEGADLLMYLATLPLPAKPYTQLVLPNGAIPTSHPLAAATGQPPTPGAPVSFGAPLAKTTKGKSDPFVAPAPPMTPKRAPGVSAAKTPQNRLTPGLLSALPSSGLTLTPTGFNMNDYVNFFTPLPGGEMLTKNLLKTPDFNNLINHDKKF